MLLSFYHKVYIFNTCFKGAVDTFPNSFLYLSIHINVMFVPSIWFILSSPPDSLHPSIPLFVSPSWPSELYGQKNASSHTHPPHWLTVTVLQSCICPVCAAKVTHTHTPTYSARNRCIILLKLHTRAELHHCTWIQFLFVLF